MTCGEYLARHSDYLDDELGLQAAAEMRLHMAGCARCARYDRVLRRGLDLLRDAEPILPATDRYIGLQEHLLRSRRLTAPEMGAPGGSVPRAPVAATVAVAGVVALVAWSALFRAAGVPASATAEVRPATPASPAPSAPPAIAGMDLVGPGVPLPRPAEWATRSLPAATGLPVARPMLLAPGPYSPLLVTEPDHGQVPAAVPVFAPYSR